MLLDGKVIKKTLLPNGIRKSDSRSYQMSCQIFDKIITDILSIHDVPEDFYNYFSTKGYGSRTRKLVDYYYKTPISWELFQQNTHHSKVKGLEFCHLNPEVEYTTHVDNVSIGTSNSNRHQGGFSFDFTWRKHLIMKIYNMLVTDENHMNLQSDLDKLTDDEFIVYIKQLKSKNNNFTITFYFSKYFCIFNTLNNHNKI